MKLYAFILNKFEWCILIIYMSTLKLLLARFGLKVNAVYFEMIDINIDIFYENQILHNCKIKIQQKLKLEEK